MHPVLIEIGRFRLYTFGVLIAAGGVLSSAFWLARREKMGLKREQDLWLLINAILFGGFIGGRLLYLFEYTRPFGSEFWGTAFSFSQGFSVMGAFIGVAGGVYWASRRLKADFLKVLDYVCQAAPFWHFFGRLGCFAAGCCYGRPPRGNLPWAVTFTDPRSLVAPELLGRALHPAQLYEGFGDLGIAMILYFLVLPRIEDGRLRCGTLAAAYFACYAVLRFATEYFRGDIVFLPFPGLTAAQAFSLALFACAAAMTIAVYRKPCTRS